MVYERKQKKRPTELGYTLFISCSTLLNMSIKGTESELYSVYSRSITGSYLIVWRPLELCQRFVTQLAYASWVEPWTPRHLFPLFSKVLFLVLRQIASSRKPEL